MSSEQHLPFAITVEVRDTCLCLHLQRAARAVARRFDAALRPLRLTNGQFSLLMSLNREEAPSIGGASALLAMDRTTLTASLKPLERRGLVKGGFPGAAPGKGAMPRESGKNSMLGITQSATRAPPGHSSLGRSLIGT